MNADFFVSEIRVYLCPFSAYYNDSTGKSSAFAPQGVNPVEMKS